MEVIHKIGRRKTAVARVYLTPGNGKVTINKRDLENYYVQKNLGEVQYKVAAVGKGKEKYMATVTVEGTQFKTYPETYNSKVKQSN